MPKEREDKVLAAASKEKLVTFTKDQVFKMVESALDLAEVGLVSQVHFQKFRSKILRIGNDMVRNLTQELNNYNINFVETSEDFLIFNIKRGKE